MTIEEGQEAEEGSFVNLDTTTDCPADDSEVKRTASYPYAQVNFYARLVKPKSKTFENDGRVIEIYRIVKIISFKIENNISQNIFFIVFVKHLG